MRITNLPKELPKSSSNPDESYPNYIYLPLSYFETSFLLASSSSYRKPGTIPSMGKVMGTVSFTIIGASGANHLPVLPQSLPNAIHHHGHDN